MTRGSSALQRVWSRAPLLAPCLLALASCQEIIPSIFVNDSSSVVVVRYTMYRAEAEPGRFMKCRFESSPERFVPTIVTGRNWDDAQWGTPVEGAKYNRDTCEAEQTLPPGSSLWIETNGACDDYEKYVKLNPALPPTLGLFVLTSPAGTVELKGFDVARAFKRQGGACLFSVSRALKQARRASSP